MLGRAPAPGRRHGPFPDDYANAAGGPAHPARRVRATAPLGLPARPPGPRPGHRVVGPAPADLPAPPLPCRDWHELAASVERALAVRLAGLRLAPCRGLVLPDGSYVSRAAA